MRPLEPAPKSRQGGRILPEIALRRSPRVLWEIRYERGCAICGTAYHLAVEENGRAFCWTHHPGRAEALLSGDPWRRALVPLRSAEFPDRRTCERILRLSGRTKPERKPARPKKRPRDRRYRR